MSGFVKNFFQNPDKIEKEECRITNLNTTIKLQRGMYSESTLVKLICTDAERKRYEEKKRFTRKADQKVFLKRLSRYCEFEIANNNKIKIKNVFPEPRTDADITYHSRVYRYLVPLLLRTIIDSGEDRKSYFTDREFIEELHIYNQNYRIVEVNREAAEKDLGISQLTHQEYFKKFPDQAHDYIERALNYLRSKCCVWFEYRLLIQPLSIKPEMHGMNVILYDESGSSLHVASEEEKKLYSELVERASAEVGIKNQQEKWYGTKSKLYTSILTELLHEHNISFAIHGFELWRCDTARCEELLNTYDVSEEECKENIGAEFKQITDKNAANRSSNRADEKYLDNFLLLTSITLPYDSPPVDLPSGISYEERLRRKQERFTLIYLRRRLGE